MSQRNTGLKTIAYELGLSINTVSRALRDCSDISESTKELVRKKAIELGYIQSTVASFIKRDEKKLIGVIVNNLDNLYFLAISQKVAKLAFLKGYDFTFILTFCDYVDTEIIKQCLSQRVDAIISTLVLDKKTIDMCRLNAIPVCLIGQNGESVPEDDYCDYVFSDIENGAVLMANYMANFHSIRRLVYVTSEKATFSYPRYEKIKAAFEAIDPKIELISLEVEEVVSEINNLISGSYFGYVCFNDELAYALLSRLNEKIPNIRKIYPHLHFIGYDGLCTMIEGLIDLTTISCNYEEMCARGFERIEIRLNATEPVKGEKIKMPVFLHQRKII